MPHYLLLAFILLGLGVLWASWVCGLVSDINLEEISIVVSWSIEFVSSAVSANKSNKGTLHFCWCFDSWCLAFSFFLIISICLLMLRICVCMLSTFSSRARSMLIIVNLKFQSDNANTPPYLALVLTCVQSLHIVIFRWKVDVTYRVYRNLVHLSVVMCWWAGGDDL